MITIRYRPHALAVGAALGLLTAGMTGCGRSAASVPPKFSTPPRQPRGGYAMQQNASGFSGGGYSSGSGGLPGNTHFGR